MLSLPTARLRTDLRRHHAPRLPQGRGWVAGFMLPDLLRACAAATAAGKTDAQHLGRLALARRRPDPHRNFRPQDVRPGRVSQHSRRREDERARHRDRRRVRRRWPRVADKMAFVRSFAHGNSGHGGGTHWVMTGYNFPPADNGQPQMQARPRLDRRPPSRRQ